MARYALRHGLPVAPDTIAELTRLVDARVGTHAEPSRDEANRTARTLAVIHRKLASSIAPATPQGVLLLDAHYRRGHPLAWLGPVPLIRMLSAAAILFLAAVIGTGLSHDVSAKNIELGLLDASGTSLLWNTMFLLACAGLGASFAALFQAHRYVAECIYDPKYDASYAARLILGLIAGLILVELLPPHLFDNGTMHSFGKPALAMLGGFSATAVHRLLHRLVDTLDTLVRGDPSAGVQATRDVHRAQAAHERTQLQAELAANLLELQQTLDATHSPEQVRQRLAELTRSMLSADTMRATPDAVKADTSRAAANEKDD
ncbi:hypothetical protein D7S89_22350 [Trinickia fusca]|uniref:Uncharacterized protein n=2 Tax=Trinickia fusca TaxID=2419777 RepID=A0A494XAJ8_9BURK|nr:hypothetical protein D7S89_22350 [Trinickia fusca]